MIVFLVSVSAVKLSEEVDVDVETDVFYPITCGDVKATLVWNKFVCPGINVKCVQVHAGPTVCLKKKKIKKKKLIHKAV